MYRRYILGLFSEKSKSNPAPHTDKMSRDKKMSDELRDIATSIFHGLDTNNDGWVSREELKEGYSQLGFNMTDTMAEAVFRKLDANKDGKITLDEYFILIKNACEQYPEEAKRAKLRRAFAECDTDKDGLLSNDEIMSGLQKAEPTVTKDQLEKKTANLHKDDKGRMKFEDVVVVIIKK